MHLIVCMHYIHVCIGSYLLSPNPSHYEHFFFPIPKTPKLELKVFIIMNEILPPLLVDAKVLKNVHIMVKSWTTKIYVNKQAVVVKNNCVIHSIDFFMTIEPSPMTWIPTSFSES